MTLVARVRQHLVETYATLDERSLGLGRMVLAAALLADLGKRVPHLRTWYTNEGLLPNHTTLWSPPYEHTFSLFFMASHWYEAAFGFALCALAYLALFVGYRTKLAQLASFVAVLSLHGRVMFIGIGGDIVLSSLVFWTLFLPLGRRFSVDSLIDELRSLAREEPRAERPSGVTHLACFALLLQLSTIYFLNAWQKNGPMWLDGTLVHYVLELDPIATRYAVALRGELTPGLTALLTHAARAAEATIPVLLLFPVFTRFARPLALLSIAGLHAGFSLLMNVGLFSLAMICYAPFLVPGALFDAWAKRGARGKTKKPERPRARLFAERVRRIAAEPESLRSVLPKMPFGKTLLEVASLPYGARLFVGLARAAVGRAERVEAAARRSVSTPPHPSDGVWLRRLPPLAVALALYASAAQAGAENPIIPERFRPPQPAFCGALVHYLQLYQGWRMFAPEAMRGDFMLTVDAVTRDGRHVDPWNELTRPGRPPPGERIPTRLGYDVYVNNYYGRIVETPAYHPAFADWVLRYHERTGRPEDQIVSFTASLLLDESPPPGEREPRKQRKQVFLKHPQN
ncbi:MAG TPA: HTTM domain-containing protein [Polyangiaceae bacterium]